MINFHPLVSTMTHFLSWKNGHMTRAKRTKSRVKIAVALFAAVATCCSSLAFSGFTDVHPSLGDLQKQVRVSACSDDFNASWNKSALVAYQKIGIYTSAINQYENQKDELLSQPVWQTSTLGNAVKIGPQAYSETSRNIAQFLIGVKTGANAINDAISAIVPESKIVDGASSFAANVQKLLSSGQDLNSVIQSKSAEELDYRAISILKPVKDNIGPVLDAAEGLYEANASSSEYSQYIQTLSERLDALDSQISQARGSIQSTEDAVRTETAAGLAMFCATKPPVAVDDAYTIAFDPGHSESLCVLQNDSDLNGDAITVDSIDVTSTLGNALLPGPDSGASTSGSCINYIQPVNFPATDHFTYTITDGKGGSASAAVSINFVKSDKPDDDFDADLKAASNRANTVASNLLDAKIKTDAAQIARNQEAADAISIRRQQIGREPSGIDGVTSFGGGLRGSYSGVSAARCQLLQQNPSQGSCDELKGCAQMQAQIATQWLQTNRAALAQPANQAQGQMVNFVLNSSNQILNTSCNNIQAVVAAQKSSTYVVGGQGRLQGNGFVGSSMISPSGLTSQSVIPGNTSPPASKTYRSCGSPPCSTH